MNRLPIKIIFLFFLLFSTNLISDETTDNVTTYPGDFETSTFEDEIYDPLEPINRAIFSFNNAVDKIVLEPAAKGYRKLPSPIQSGISNFLGNLKLPLVILNQISSFFQVFIFSFQVFLFKFSNRDTFPTKIS